LFYVSLLIYPLPDRFSVAHTVEISRSLIDPPTTLLSILAITGSVVFLIFRARKNPLISFSFLFFFLNHLVESSIIPLELVFEHRNYVPSMMFFLPFALWFNSLLNFRIHQWAIKPFASGLILFIVLFLGYSTYLRNLVWKNPGTLWGDALQKAPDQLRVHHNLGFYYQERGLKQEALSHYQQALRSPVINRKDEPVGTYYQLGKLYGEMREYEKAKSAYKHAISMKPDLAWALVDLASIYDQEGDRTKADEYLARALQVSPSDPSVNLNVGVYYLRARNPEVAIQHLGIALKEKKLQSKSLMYLGIASKQREQYEMSEHQFKESLVLNPKNITPQLHLAEIYIRTGKQKEAKAETKRITDILMTDRNLFLQVIDLIVKEGNRGDVCLSKELLLPLFSRSLEEGPNYEMREEIKKMIEKWMQVR
jgi:Tfp pilus assembly protein PilF